MLSRRMRIDGLRVKEIADSRGLTADDIARMSWVKYTTVHNIFTGRTVNPELLTILPIARVLGVSVEDLVVEAEDETEGLSEGKKFEPAYALA